MIRLSEIRVWTALIVSGLSSFTLWQGWTVASFGFAEAFATPETAEERLLNFVARPAVGHLAYRDLLQLTTSAYAASRADDLTIFLAGRPLASGAWLDLGAARLATQAGSEEVAQCLALSNLTGPNEAQLMAARVMFGLPMWASLPPEFRRSLTTDLVSSWAYIDGANRAGLKTIMEQAVGKTREEIRASLLLSGKSGVGIAKALDLKPAPVSTEDMRTLPKP